MTPSTETALLLASARRHMDATTSAAANAAIRDGIDWDVFLPLAEQHGLILLIQHHVTAGAISSAAVPAPALTALQSRATNIALRSLYLTSELIAILRDFAAHEISCVPLKGPVLAHSLYGSIALRKFIDLDVLIHEYDLPRAMARLQARGYTCPTTFDDMTRRTTHHVSMFASSGSYRVELHYHLLPPVGRKQYHLADIMDYLSPAMFQGVPIQVLSDEMLLTYLCLHGAQHMWQRLEWLCGVAELLRSGRVYNWSSVSQCAHRFDAVRRVRTTLVIAHQLLGAPMPDTMLDTDDWAQDTARSVIRRYISSPGETFSAAQRYMHQLRLDANSRVRLHRNWMIFCRLQTAGRAAFPLPRLLWPLYYLLRPLWMFYHHGVKRVRWPRAGL